MTDYQIAGLAIFVPIFIFFIGAVVVIILNDGGGYD